MVTRKKTESTAVVEWQQEMAKAAVAAAAQEESTASGQFFGIKGGILKFNDSALPGNRMAVVIVDAILENVYFEGEYDPDVPQAPVCFAFGRDDKELAPHKNVAETEGFDQQCETCAKCEKNQFGTAERGRGKACRNTRRLAMIAAGSFDKAGNFTAFTEEEKFTKGQLGFMKLPVTSVKGYAGYVKQLTGTLGRPPFGVFTEVRVEPDEKSQFKVIFEALGEVPDELMPAVFERVKEAKATIEQPYSPLDPEAAAPKPAARGKKAAAPARGKSKY